MFKLNKIQADENGFASIVIALILIVVLGLLTVGFAQLARQEQQNALTNQLSNQAFDAAESGVNDAYADIQSGVINSQTASLTQCMNNGGTGINAINTPNARILNDQIDSQHDIGYSCVLADIDPSDLHFDVNTGHSATITMVTEGQPLSSLVIAWNSTDGHGYSDSAPPNTMTGFLPANIWDDAAHNYDGVLETSITPLGLGNNLTTATMDNDTFETIGYPVVTVLGNQTDGPDYVPQSQNPNTAPNQAPITPSMCNHSYCTAYGFGIHNLPTNYGPSTPTTKYYYLLRIADFYDDSDIVVTGVKADGSTAHFYDSEALIDVTGHAHNVVKRIQVYVPLTQEAQLPLAALNAKNICKQFTTDPKAGETGPPYDNGGSCN
jgi:hypothetical protein